MNFSHPFRFLTAAAVLPAITAAQVATTSIEIESLTSDDIQYQSSNFQYSDEGFADLSLVVGWKQISIDYQSAGFPIDIVTTDLARKESELSLSAEATFKVHQRWEFTPSLTYSNGFSSHSAIWLDEYYKQLWSGRTIPGDRYGNPSPQTLGAGLQLRWEYLPANAFLSGGFSYAGRHIAPGYEFEVEGEHAGELVRGLEELKTVTYNLALENNLTHRWRTVNSLVASDTTAREVRFTFEHQSFVALGQNWVARTSLGYAREGSDFEATRGNLRIVREFGFEWSAFAGVGLYKDNGEVEQANLATDAAPDLESHHWVTGIQWKSFDQHKRVSLSLGKFEQSYAINQLDQRFQNLYSNRDWWLVKVSYSHTF